MKKTGNNVRFISFLLISFLIINSCEPDQEDIRDEITGQWTCTETINNNQNVGYKVSIDKSDSDASTIYINNFYDINARISVTVEGRNLTIDPQTGEGFTFSGSGTVSSDYETIELTYTANDGAGGIDHVKSTYRR